MPREWNPAWVTPSQYEEPASSEDEQIRVTKLMIMASINWVEAHLDAKPTWQAISEERMLRDLGAPKGAKAVIIGQWPDYIHPTSKDAEEWFEAIELACTNGDKSLEPSYNMMKKAIACGTLLKLKGWDAFNVLMMTIGSTETTH